MRRNTRRKFLCGSLSFPMTPFKVISHSIKEIMTACRVNITFFPIFHFLFWTYTLPTWLSQANGVNFVNWQNWMLLLTWSFMLTSNILVGWRSKILILFEVLLNRSILEVLLWDQHQQKKLEHKRMGVSGCVSESVMSRSNIIRQRNHDLNLLLAIINISMSFNTASMTFCVYFK